MWWSIARDWFLSWERTCNGTGSVYPAFKHLIKVDSGTRELLRLSQKTLKQKWNISRNAIMKYNPPPTAAALWWCDALVTLLLSVDELGGGFLILEMRRMEVEECEVYLMFQRNWQQLPWHFAQMKWIPYDDRRVNSLGWKQVSRLLPHRHRRSHVQRHVNMCLLHMVFQFLLMEHRATHVYCQL